jgi:CDP-2,3-bis-(O-geranylgeranyl)-sn-glycerol synthase
LIDIIFQTLLLIAPAGVANMSPVLFKWLPVLNKPVDFGKTFGGKPLFGKNKTYRGFLVGILMAILVVYLEKILYNFLAPYSIVDYSQINIFWLGFLLGFGALFGDLIESFMKRQKGVAPGKSWAPFDQIDWVLGALIFVHLYFPIGLSIWITALIIFGLLHPVINLIGYYLGIKKNKF